MDLPRLKREYELLEELDAASDLISIEANKFVAPNAPTHYIVKYKVKGLRKDHRTGKIYVYDPIIDGGYHVVEIKIPSLFPHLPPDIRFLTPIFHPNIVDPGAPPENFQKARRGHICLAQWRPSRSLKEIVLEIGEMIQLKRHGVGPNGTSFIDIMWGTPVCEEAAEWIRKNIHKLPIDDRPLVKSLTMVPVEIEISDIEIEIKIDEESKEDVIEI